ncbi:DUF3850 domain-containing protein [Adonisia turfae]|uniref:DUF3850 domain-containing protein n=1 Tax=Adonisia turfae CCMR0081 TaxID=2292702 RepID=A0A6M0RFH0_9CYAN|nr:DUF3850 domain-containing protein [Adonisia turfae]NEZ54976.1 DUF3850 domain-containing protein [Adonisia turfae CCMR0081]
MNTTTQPTTHNLKSWPHHFWPVVRGEKPFEIRKNDRDFKVGDYLALQEYDPALAARAMESLDSSDRESVEQAIQSGYTGQNSLFQITYITDFQQQAGYVVMGIKSVSGSEGKDLTQILEQEQQDLAGQIEIEGVGA